jgi:hypothetical protein
VAKVGIQQSGLISAAPRVAYGLCDSERQLLEMLTHGQPVPPHDAFQLRNWAVHPEDAALSLEEIACRILAHEGNSKGGGGKNVISSQSLHHSLKPP